MAWTEMICTLWPFARLLATVKGEFSQKSIVSGGRLSAIVYILVASRQPISIEHQLSPFGDSRTTDQGPRVQYLNSHFPAFRSK